MEQIIINTAVPKMIQGIKREDVSTDDLKYFNRLVDIIDWRGDNLLIQKNSNYRVGRVIFGKKVFIVPPPFDPHIFVDFFLYASGVNLENSLFRKSAFVDLSRIRQSDQFLLLMALLYIDITEDLLSKGPARRYETELKRIKVIRGKPTWSRDFGHHPSLGITCKYSTLTTENLLNQIILAGLLSIERIVYGSRLQSRLLSQIFAWRSLTNPIIPTISDFIRAERQINNLTDSYRAALIFAKAFILGYSPDNPFFGTTSNLQELEFSLPSLFEDFIERFIQAVVPYFGFTSRSQAIDNEAIIDGEGSNYRDIKPDIVIYKDNLPIAIVDTKYKPRYVNNNPGTTIPKEKRVTNSDIYQIFFYQARFQLINELLEPPIALIIAPQVPIKRSISELSKRTIHWYTEKEDTLKYKLTVIPFPIADILACLRKGDNEFMSLHIASELLESLQELS